MGCHCDHITGFALDPPFDVPDSLAGQGALLIGLPFLLESADRDRIVVLRGEKGPGLDALADVAAGRWRAAAGVVDRVDPAVAPVERTGAPALVVADLTGSQTFPSPASWQALVRGLRAEDRLLVLTRDPLVMPVDGYRLIELRVRPRAAAGDALAA